MYTGLVEEIGVVAHANSPHVRIDATKILDDVAIGDSIAVNGCCITVTAFGNGWWEADLSAETLARSTLGGLTVGDAVNLERPLRLSDRLGGHLVQGHVDAIATVVAPPPNLEVRVPADLMRYVVEKGSVALDGVSLTVVDALPNGFTVALVPHTTEVTTLGHRVGGDHMNLEVDITAKHIERLLSART